MKPTLIALVCSAAALAPFTCGRAATTFEPPRLVSAPDPTLPRTATADGDTYGMQVAPDGAWVLLLSDANDFTTNLHQNAILDLYLYDRGSKSAKLISADSTGTRGGDGQSGVGRATGDGRYVVFESEAQNLVPGIDTNDRSDIFVRDVAAGTTRLISVNRPGTATGLGSSQDPRITPDARYVVFSSTAEDLVDGDTNGLPDVFVRDLVENTTEWITAGSASPEFAPGFYAGSTGPQITADGRWVAFTSTATNLVAGVSNPFGEIYLRDRFQGTTLCPSATVFDEWPILDEATLLERRAISLALSEDGEILAFIAEATVSPPVGVVRGLWRFEIGSAQATLVTTNITSGLFLKDTSYTMTPDGRWFAYLTPTQNDRNDIELWDSQAGLTVLATAAWDGNSGADGFCDLPELSSDGRFVVFVSHAGNLVTNEINGTINVYVRDVEAAQTELISADAGGRALGGTELSPPSISEDGSLVVFDSFETGYVMEDRNNSYDVFVREREGGSIELVSRAELAVAMGSGNGVSSLSHAPFSEDGGRLVFRSESDNLAPGVVRGMDQVYLHDIASGTNGLVSLNWAGDRAAIGWCCEQTISGNGRFIAFTSSADDLTSADSNGRRDVFVHDLESRSTSLVSRALDSGLAGNDTSRSPSISRDGNWVSFLSSATNLVETPPGWRPQIYLHDRQSHHTVIVSNFDFPIPWFRSSLSSDGRYLAYGPTRPWNLESLQLYDHVTTLVTNVSTRALFAGECFSRDGRYLVTASWYGWAIYLLRRDLASGSNQQFEIGSGATLSGDITMDDSARFIAFSTEWSLAAADTNRVMDVYLFDFDAATLFLVSLNDARTAAGAGPSRSPSISGDGRLVAFSSDAGDLVPGDTNGAADVFVYDRETGELAVASANALGGVANERSTNPHLSPHGYRLAFTSRAADFVPNVRNTVNDILMTTVHPFQPADADGDGLEDQWELGYFGGLQALPGDHADADGFTNREEYIAGTDPLVPLSYPRLDIVATSEAQVRLCWNASPGRTYVVESTTDPAESSWIETPGITRITGASAEFEESEPREAPGFFRLKVTHENGL